MVRLLFVASLLFLVGKAVAGSGGTANDITVSAPEFSPLGTGTIRITMVSSTVPVAFLQSCDIHTRVVVERRIAGAWHTHRRLVRRQCEYDPAPARYLGQRTNTRLPLTMPGEYRLLVFYHPEHHGKPRVALSNAFEIRASRTATTLAGTATTP